MSNYPGIIPYFEQKSRKKPNFFAKKTKNIRREAGQNPESEALLQTFWSFGHYDFGFVYDLGFRD